MAKTFHKKPDGSTVIKESNGKIVSNLPAPDSYAAPTAAPTVPTTASLDAGTQADYERWFASFQERSQGPVGSDVEALTAHIDLIDRQIASVNEAFAGVDDDTAVIPLAGIPGVTVDHAFADDALLTRKEAVDLMRLEKALLREKRTQVLLGDAPLNEFGNGPLGVAEVEAFAEPNTRAWLLARTQGIGGSDKIGFVDEDGEFKSYDSIDKRNYLNQMLRSKGPAAIAEIESRPAEKPAEKDQPLAIRIGNHLERTIQFEFAQANPQYDHLEDKYTRTAPGRSWHRFNPDGVLREQETGRLGIFEAKTSRDSATFDKAVPGYLAQCLHNAAAADLDFAVLVADVEGEKTQRVIRIDFTPEQRQNYRDAVDRVWLLYKPQWDKNEARNLALEARASQD